MINGPTISRRSFIIASAAVGGGLAIGINPFRSIAAVRAADGSPEITAWVVIRPDDTVVVRIARSEMGQGSLTGLAQLVAEELECDWNKITWEYPTPGTSLARQKPWGPFGTGGSASIRGSHEYVRKGGASARMMLVQAAANGWNVPAAECALKRASFRTKLPAARRRTGR
jgi:isoquinoline 1-oxidoreductase beta subunit